MLFFFAVLSARAASISQCQSSPISVPVPGGYTLHVEIHGNCSGRPLLYFHGGWGPLNSDLNVVPSSYRIVYFHQRGWGLSQPQGSIVNNTYLDVIEDAQVIRNYLGIHVPWVVFGGSNGATLAMMYSAQYAQHVAGVVVRGYWAMTLDQVSWDYLGAGKRTIWPEEWKRVCDIVNCSGADLLESYRKELAGPPGDDGCNSDAPPSVCSVGCAWLRWDALGEAIAEVPSNMCNPTGSKIEWYQLHPAAASRLGVHFYLRKHVVPDLTNLLASGKPVHFINGRFDMLCPPGFAAELVFKAEDIGATSWKHTIVEHAAHSGTDPGMTHAIRDALTHVGHQLKAAKLPTLNLAWV